VLKGDLNLEIIVNNKTIDKNVNVIQLETAVGAAMKNFNRGLGEYNILVRNSANSLPSSI
jgi:UTP--glucose-1-phosphate uridylyltransferase.